MLFTHCDADIRVIEIITLPTILAYLIRRKDGSQRGLCFQVCDNRGLDKVYRDHSLPSFNSLPLDGLTYGNP